MQRIVLFPDTNIFLQCKSLQDLPWEDVFDVDQVDLLVGAPVQDEIDRLKQDGNHRRARRARDTHNLFRQALASSDETVTLRDGRPRVVLTFAPLLPVGRPTIPTLDLSRADDRLIDEVRHYQNGVLPDGVVSLILTSDTGMKLRARRHDVAVADVPDGWMLPPESDTRDKEISKLRAELERLRNAAPILDVALQDANRQAISSIGATLPFYPPLSGHDVDGLITEIKARYPQATDFGIDPPPSRAPTEDASTPLSRLALSIHTALSSMHKWRPPTQDEITCYQQGYKEWIDKARERFHRLDSRLNASLRIIPLQLQLRNTGSQPADEVLIEFICYDGLRLCTSADNEVPEPMQRLHKLDRTVILQPPPIAPKGEFVFAAFADSMRLGAHAIRLDADNYLPVYPPLNTPVFNRDRHLFYRREDDENATANSSFSCIELRHQSDAQIFRIWVIVPATSDPQRSRLHVRVSARNVERPCELHIPITIDNARHSTLDTAKRWAIASKEKRRMSLSDLAMPTPRQSGTRESGDT